MRRSQEVCSVIGWYEHPRVSLIENIVEYKMSLKGGDELVFENGL